MQPRSRREASPRSSDRVSGAAEPVNKIRPASSRRSAVAGSAGRRIPGGTRINALENLRACNRAGDHHQKVAVAVQKETKTAQRHSQMQGRQMQRCKGAFARDFTAQEARNTGAVITDGPGALLFDGSQRRLKAKAEPEAEAEDKRQINEGGDEEGARHGCVLSHAQVPETGAADGVQAPGLGRTVKFFFAGPMAPPRASGRAKKWFTLDLADA